MHDVYLVAGQLHLHSLSKLLLMLLVKLCSPCDCYLFPAFVAGKLYRSRDLDHLSQLLLMFFQEQPVDYTYLYFNMLMTQLQKRLRTPTLFQHRGIHSSFPGTLPVHFLPITPHVCVCVSGGGGWVGVWGGGMNVWVRMYAYMCVCV